MRTKTIYVKDKEMLKNFPNFSVKESITEMKNKYYGKDALFVRCGAFIYDVTSAPHIYYYAH